MQILIYEYVSAVLGCAIVYACAVKLNDLRRCNSLWYRYAYVVSGIGGACMPLTFMLPTVFNEWPPLLVALGALMIFLKDKRRPLKGERKS